MKSVYYSGKSYSVVLSRIMCRFYPKTGNGSHLNYRAGLAQCFSKYNSALSAYESRKALYENQSIYHLPWCFIVPCLPQGKSIAFLSICFDC